MLEKVKSKLVISLFISTFFMLSLIFFFSKIWLKKEILVGFSGQLTGINAELGVDGRNGIIFAFEEINMSGGINGKKIRLIAKDDYGIPDKAASVNTELIDSGVVAIIGHMTSSQSMAGRKVTEKKRVVLFSPTTSTPVLTGKKDYFFRLQTGLDFSAEILGEFASKIKNLDTILILKDINNKDFATPFQTAFLKGIQKEKQIQNEVFNFSSLDNINWTSKIVDLNIEKFNGVFIIASARTTASIVQAIKKTKKEMTLMSSSWAATKSLIQHGGRTVEGLYLSKTVVVNKAHKDYKIFSDNYKKRFGKKPTFASDHSYHAARILGMALKATNGKKEGLKEALSSISEYEYFYGKKGMDEYGDAFSKVFIMVIKDGKFKVVSEYFKGN